MGVWRQAHRAVSSLPQLRGCYGRPALGRAISRGTYRQDRCSGKDVCVADDRVLLIDVENAVGPVAPGAGVVRSRVRALIDAAGEPHHVLACYAPQDPQADRTVSVLAEMGVATWQVAKGVDAADHALIQHARYLQAAGSRRSSSPPGTACSLCWPSWGAWRCWCGSPSRCRGG